MTGKVNHWVKTVGLVSIQLAQIYCKYSVDHFKIRTSYLIYAASVFSASMRIREQIALRRGKSYTQSKAESHATQVLSKIRQRITSPRAISKISERLYLLYRNQVNSVTGKEDRKHFVVQEIFKSIYIIKQHLQIGRCSCSHAPNSCSLNICRCGGTAWTGTDPPLTHSVDLQEDKKYIYAHTLF